MRQEDAELLTEHFLPIAFRAYNFFQSAFERGELQENGSVKNFAYVWTPPATVRANPVRHREVDASLGRLMRLGVRLPIALVTALQDLPKGSLSVVKTRKGELTLRVAIPQGRNVFSKPNRPPSGWSRQGPVLSKNEYARAFSALASFAAGRLAMHEDWPTRVRPARPHSKPFAQHVHRDAFRRLVVSGPMSEWLKR